MITITNKVSIRDPETDVLHEHFEGFCDSTDVKPLDWPNSSVLVEMDTSKAFVFRASNKSWAEL